MGEPTPTVKEFPPFRPMAYFGGNLLLGGLSYILLRKYGRFFMLFTLFVIAALVTMTIPGDRGGVIGKVTSYALLTASATDAYFIAKKFKNKTLSEPQYREGLTCLAVALWVVWIFLMLIGL